MRNISLVILAVGAATAYAGQWEVIWEDDFESKVIDTTKWNFENGNNNGWGNHEWEYYTQRPENARVDDEGNLVITARKEEYKGSHYTSARMNTKGKFSFN